jgi:hypothetical protein
MLSKALRNTGGRNTGGRKRGGRNTGGRKTRTRRVRATPMPVAKTLKQGAKCAAAVELAHTTGSVVCGSLSKIFTTITCLCSNPLIMIAVGFGVFALAGMLLARFT